jgi:uncharacterized protein YcaQ
MVREISLSSARRLAIAAQGLGHERPSGRVTRRHLSSLMKQIGLIQIDSVNVLARSHELVLFSRLGDHPGDLISRATSQGDLFEYWGHEAAHIPVVHHPLFRFRMQENSDGHWIQRVSRELQKGNPKFLDEVLQRVRENGPIVASDISTRRGPKGPWWDWDTGKRALEVLFWRGDVTAYRRSSDFARVYDVVDRVLPKDVLSIPTPGEYDSRKQLLLIAARSCGVGTARDLADYHRQKPKECEHIVRDLVESGELEKVRVEGWRDDAFIVPHTSIPRSISARALLSPFDSLIWFRPRTERLFDFHYRLEIYTPASKRKFGYYVLPFLLDDQLVARVDLKADRHAKVLRVNAAYKEDGIDTQRTSKELAKELTLMMQWLNLSDIQVQRKGNLSNALRQHLK